MTQPLLSLRAVARHYLAGDNVTRALDGVTLDICAGEFVAIMGASGSGKSTLMNMIGCLDRPTSGAYLIGGDDVSALDRDQQAALRCRMFGFVYQRYNLMDSATALENVELPAIYAGTSAAARKAQAQLLLQRLGLGDKALAPPAQLSGGQQQRVAIARALVNDPHVLLADEPTGALDSASGHEVMELLKAVHAQGRTVIIITHDDSVAAHAGRQIRIADGKIVSDSGAKGGQCASPAPRPNPHADTGAEIGEAVKMAARSLRLNWFRALLTLLGIIIGVASVVVMLAVGDGSKKKVIDQITAMGTNLLIVRPGAPGIRLSTDVSTLTLDDAHAISALPNVVAVNPERSGRFTVRYGHIDQSVSVIGTSPMQPLVNNWPVVEGAAMTDADFRRMAPVALIGQTVKRNLFPFGDDPVGKTILIKSIPFEIIGVMGAKGASMFGSDQDDVVFVPLTTGIVRLFGRSHLSMIAVQVADMAHIVETQNEIGRLLFDRHRVEDFSVRNMSAFIDMARQTQQALTLLLGSVALIALVVGGIGVMNIMLVSVTERTREIGVRMAAGARTRDILLQFLTEAVVVCLTGGVAGVALGVGVSLLLDRVGLGAILTAPPIILAFTSAVGTGVIFGYLPARKAARLDPVAALAAD